MSASLRLHGLQYVRLPVFHFLLEFAQTHVTELVMPSNHLILCHLLLLLPSVFHSIRVFTTSGGQSIGASASASVLPVNIQGCLFSFRINWFDLLAFQGNLKSLLQHQRSKASILWHSAFLWSNFHQCCKYTARLIS